MESVLILCKNGPFGSNSGVEAIRLGAGYLGLGEDIDCKLVFYQAGVTNLVNNLNPERVNMDAMDEAIEMADLTELPIVVVREDLFQFGFSEENLIDYEALTVVNQDDLPGIIDEYSMVFHM
ncbi:DsrE family protein [Candidatus Harpocratesius sp.]